MVSVVMGDPPCVLVSYACFSRSESSHPHYTPRYDASPKSVPLLRREAGRYNHAMLRYLTSGGPEARRRHRMLCHRQACRRIADDRQARIVGLAAMHYIEPILLAETRCLDPLVGGQRHSAVSSAPLDLDIANLVRAGRAQI